MEKRVIQVRQRRSPIGLFPIYNSWSNKKVLLYLDMEEFIFFEDSWNIYERGTSPTSPSPDDTERSRGPEEIYKKK